VELAKDGWTDAEVRAGKRTLAKAEAWRKIAQKSPRGAMQVKEWQEETKDKPVKERR
jgi:hypothetical protein